jgi:hypothetical protein
LSIAVEKRKRVICERRSGNGKTDDVVTDPSAEWSRMHLCVRVLWVALINPGLICQFVHLTASEQDRLNYF